MSPTTDSELIRWTMTEKTRATILCALEEASEGKRYKIGVCADCQDASCGSCEYRRESAAEYDSVAEIITETYDTTPQAGPEPESDTETWQQAMGRLVRASPGYADLLAIQEGREAARRPDRASDSNDHRRAVTPAPP
jgi:hypothetical protein